MNYTIEKQLKKAPIVKYIMIGSISLTLLLWILGLALSIIQITAAENYIFYGYCFDNTCLYCDVSSTV